MGQAVHGGYEVVIFVTGLMRSGTTPLAMMLHQMGVTMGTMTRFPLHNKHSHFEWEDAELADSLLALIMKPREEDTPERLIDYYVRKRIHEANGKPWGVKTPFLLPFITQLRSVLDKIGDPFTIIVTQRDYKDTIESLRRQTSHLSEFQRGGAFPNLVKIQEHLASYWKDGADGSTIFDFKEAHEYPRMAAKRLAGIAGIDPDIDSAIRGIRGGEL